MKKLLLCLATALALVACDQAGPAPELEFESQSSQTSPSFKDTVRSTTTDAWKLMDGEVGTGDEMSWGYDGTAWWDEASYPISAQFDLGEDFVITKFRYYVGNLRDPTVSELKFYVSKDGQSWSEVAQGLGGTWNSWAEVDTHWYGRYVKVEFTEYEAFFNLSEVEVYGFKLSPCLVEGQCGPGGNPTILP